MSTNPDNQTLEYYVASKGGLVIITLVGAFKDCEATVAKCIADVVSANAQHCIIYARDMTALPPSAFKDMVHLQNTLRQQFGGNFKICSLNPTLKVNLLAKGIVRQHELTNNLKETVFSLLKK